MKQLNGQEIIVIDTNVLVSGLGWKGKPNKILKLIEKNQYTLIISDEQLFEIERVIKYSKLKFDITKQKNILNYLKEISGLLISSLKVDLCRDPNDNMILASAIEANADFIITGDKDLLVLKEVNGIKIVTVSEFLRKNVCGI
jgi:uncharacterized protein